MVKEDLIKRMTYLICRTHQMVNIVVDETPIGDTFCKLDEALN